MTPVVPVLGKKNSLNRGPIGTVKPPTFEENWQNSGFMLYFTVLGENKSASLNVPELRDRAHVYLNKVSTVMYTMLL